jgi:predicted amidohydrolase
MGVFAAIQMTSCLAIGPNLMQAKMQILKAAEQGAKFILLPEHFAYFPRHSSDFLTAAEVFGGTDREQSRIQFFLSDMAELTGCYIAGTVPLLAENLGSSESPATPEKVFQSLLVFDPAGKAVARYDRSHLFHGEGSRSLGVIGQEGLFVQSGDSRNPVVLDTPLGRIGLAIGFDWRFPNFFQALRQKGAQIILVPSSCSYALADAHWHILMGARAIENQVFVVAANQYGLHDNHQESYGESLILGPWGDVLDHIEQGVGPVLAEIDLLHLEVLREEFLVVER